MIANRESGEIELISRAKIYKIRYSLAALMNLEELFGSLEEAGKALQTGRLAPVVDFLQCGLECDSPAGRYTRTEVIHIIEGVVGPSVVERMMIAVNLATRAYELAFPEAAAKALTQPQTSEEEAGEESGAEKRRKNLSAPMAATTGEKSSA